MPALRAGAALLACLSACAASRPARTVRFDPEGMVVGRVVILDNKAHTDEEITSRLATREKRSSLGFPKKRFDPLAFQIDQRRVVAFYHERGYFEAEVTATGFEKTRFDDLLVWLRVREGPPTRIASVELRGGPETLLADAKLKTGDVFDHRRYRSAKQEIRAALIEAGFAHARVEGTVQVDRDAHTAAIELRVDQGPLVSFGETSVETVPSLENAVAARAAWTKGRTFDPVRIERTKQRLRAMGLFAGVRVDYPRDGRPPIVDMTIHAPPAARNEVKVGFGAETDNFPFNLDHARFETRARASYARKRWPWALSLSRVEGEVGVLPLADVDVEERFFYEARASLQQWDLALPRMRWTFTVAADRDVYEAYAIWGVLRAFAGFEYPVWDDKLLLGGGFHLLPYLIVEPNDDALAAGLGVDNPLRLAIVEGSVTWDDRDKPLDAHRGTYAQLAAEGGASPLYSKATVEARAYRPRSKRFVIAGRARVGVLHGFEDDGETPITQRFYGGGAYSHRGFGYRRLSPTIPDADGEQVPIGGAALVETGVELRADVIGRLGAVLFLDGGDVTAAPEDLFEKNLHWAAGAGIRIDTELGPLRIDGAVRLNRMGAGEPDGGSDFVDRIVGHISFGEAF